MTILKTLKLENSRVYLFTSYNCHKINIRFLDLQRIATTQ